MTTEPLASNASFGFAPEAMLRVEPGGGLLVLTPGGWESVGSHALLLLQMFEEPVPISRAVERVGGRLSGAQDVANLLGEVTRLVELGVLVEMDEGAARVARAPEQTGAFDRHSIHIRMLEDRARTDGFRRAIRSVVKPGDVVLDIGTGTGILAATAAQAGASKVFAVEAGAMADVAETLARDPRLSGRVHVLRGWSTAIPLEERADVLVTETIGDDPFGEQIVEIVGDAWRRLLKPGARVIPSRLRVLGQAVLIPERLRRRYVFTPETLARWEAWYRVPFATISDEGSHSPGGRIPLTKVYLKPQQARPWQPLAPPTLLAEAALDRPGPVVVEHPRELVVERDAACWGVVIFFEADLAPGLSLSTEPGRTRRTNSWHSPVWIASPGFGVAADERLSLELTYRRGSTWLSCRRAS